MEGRRKEDSKATTGELTAYRQEARAPLGQGDSNTTSNPTVGDGCGQVQDVERMTTNVWMDMMGTAEVSELQEEAPVRGRVTALDSEGMFDADRLLFFQADNNG